MKTGRNNIFMIMLLLVFCALLTGCAGSGKSSAQVAAQLFREARYAEAEEQFLMALESGDASDSVRLGHAYNLVAMGKIQNALDEFLTVQDSFEDEALTLSIRRTMLDLYLDMDNRPGAARVCTELARLISNREQADEYTLEAAQIKADMYREEGNGDLLENELRTIISLKPYAGDEYLELYSMYINGGERGKRLALADEILAYMKGHASYVSDYRQVIAVAFDAANMAVEKSEDYFVIAEEWIAMAENAGFSEEDILKYKVIIAERRGKMELAYKLLGVYLNHCPDDRYAQKELDYLENRLNLAEP